MKFHMKLPHLLFPEYVGVILLDGQAVDRNTPYHPIVHPDMGPHPDRVPFSIGGLEHRIKAESTPEDPDQPEFRKIHPLQGRKVFGGFFLLSDHDDRAKRIPSA